MSFAAKMIVLMMPVWQDKLIPTNTVKILDLVSAINLACYRRYGDDLINVAGMSIFAGAYFGISWEKAGFDIGKFPVGICTAILEMI